MKWSSQELLDTLNKETNQKEINALWGALIHYELGLEKINQKALDKFFEKWYNDNNETSIISQELLDLFQNIMDELSIENILEKI